MILHQKTLEKLRQLINEKTEYRTGPKLVTFFNNLGFNDSYSEGFPSRWKFTDEKLSKINGTPELDKCIIQLFAPVNFIGNFTHLDKMIDDFNKFLVFDSWKVIRDGATISFGKADKIIFEETNSKANSIEDDFLKKEFDELGLDTLNLETSLTETLNLRLSEIKKCLSVEAPLSVIFLCGSTLEGLLNGIANKHPRVYNTASKAPTKEGRVKHLSEWTLANLIEVSCEVGYLNEDVKKFSHSLRDFRNYIHPGEQVKNRFNPDHNTSKISWQVLKVAIHQISQKINSTPLS
ncbi:hypothetical protein SD960_20940 [Flavobacterium sp. MMLR14_040]|uniref:hypothetical protein n=1 Tax=Flavobacterium sp. MMLR14_040 TaxID=3093843 RepID=UPI002990427A|nr:hypothetical protein [Flavobacterium sp. MMLR14_040]MDW8852581.1 hypothetical protein [Flavobacterium sp. MMLR14_040]